MGMFQSWQLILHAFLGGGGGGGMDKPFASYIMMVHF